MRKASDYAQQYLDAPAMKRANSLALEEIIKLAQTEAFAEGKQAGMSTFLNIALKSSGIPKSIEPDLFDDGSHLMNLAG